MPSPQLVKPVSEPIVEAVLQDPVVKAAIASEVGDKSGERRNPQRAVPSDKGLVAPPTETEEEQRVTAGQRAINLIWETTQMRVALSVIWSALVTSTILTIFGRYLGSEDLQLAAAVFLFGVANLVTGFYFGRTNHQKTGGTGSKEIGR